MIKEKPLEYWNVILSILTKWKQLGSKTLSTGATLIGHVPSVAPEAWLHCYYAPLASAQIAEMELKLQNRFPLEFSEFLSRSNGMNIFSDSLSIWGLRNNFERTGESAWQPYDLILMNFPAERPKNATDEMVFIGSYNWDGSKLYFKNIPSERSRIFRCSAESAKPLNVWADFWTMLTDETGRLSVLFTDQGVEKNPDEPTIPL